MRNITIVTGSRADYGILKPVMQAVKDRDNLRLSILATGMHMLEKFGHTLDEVKADWETVLTVLLQSEKVDPLEDGKEMGEALHTMTCLFDDADIVVVLGDRLEMFTAAAAAVVSGKILAHIHGGDIAPGLRDEQYRHAISKLAHIHFPASDEALRILLQMGEPSWRIFNHGSPALDGLEKIESRNEKFLLVVQHPYNGSAGFEKDAMTQTLKACINSGLSVCVIWPNCDEGHNGIIAAIQSAQGDNLIVHKNLPRPQYLRLLSTCTALVGNSSSGIIEASFLGVPVINIGGRQAGRARGENVIDIDYGAKNVAAAIQRVLIKNKRPPRSYIYGNGESGIRIAETLEKVKVNQQLKHKKWEK